MLIVLLILIATALVCILSGLPARRQWVVRWAAVVGAALALLVSVTAEGMGTASTLGVEVPWPAPLKWLGEPVFRSDALAAGLGAWSLLLGLLCLLKMVGEDAAPAQLAASVGLTALLYSLAHTDHLLAFAGQLFLLAGLSLLYGREGGAPADFGRRASALALGACLFLAAALLMGRTTGGAYSLFELSLSTLTFWALLLITGFTVLWLGVPPVIGWSARTGDNLKDPAAALLQVLVVGVPVMALLLRLQGLVSREALVGTVPGNWSGFMAALGWLGATGAVVAAAGILTAAGRTRWTALLTAWAMCLSLWALSLDSAPGRLAALVIFFAYGAGRMLSVLAGRGERSGMPLLGAVPSLAGIIGAASLAAAPLTPAFVGLWLLASALAEGEHPGLGLLPVGAGILAACGVALHIASIKLGRPSTEANGGRVYNTILLWVGAAFGVAGLLGGVLPGLWLPLAARMAAVGGGSASVVTPGQGLAAGDLFLPLPFLALGTLLLSALGWLLSAWARSRAEGIGGGVLLPAGLAQLGPAEIEREVQDNTAQPTKGAGVVSPLASLVNPSSAVWCLSLLWLEEGVWGFGVVLGRLGVRFGGLLGRLEGRFYLPLALILALIALLVASR